MTRSASKLLKTRTASPHSELTGWHQTTAFLGQPPSVVPRWANNGMPVRREGRQIVAAPDELNRWLGREAGGEPVQVATPDTDLSADLKRGLAYVRSRADYYYNGINSGGALVSVTGSRTGEARRILENAGGDLRESGFEAVTTSPASGSEEVRRIQLRGEMLRTYKERVQRGEVRLRKDVVSENKTIQVPVTREELVVERVPASGAAATGEIGTDQEIRVPLSEERVRTEKQPVVTDEVRVGRRTVQNTETVSDNVRHEELRADKDGDVEIDTKGSETTKRKKPAA